MLPTFKSILSELFSKYWTSAIDTMYFTYVLMIVNFRLTQAMWTVLNLVDLTVS